MIKKSLRRSNNERSLKRLLKDLRKYSGWIVLSLLMIFLEIYASISFAKVLGKITNVAIAKDMTLLINYFKIGLGVCLLDLVAKYIRGYSSGRFSEQSVFRIREKYYKHIMRLQFEVLDRHSTGELASRISNDLNIVQRFLEKNLFDLIAIPVKISAFSFVLFSINWKLALFTYISIPAMMILLMVISKPIEKIIKREQEELSDASSVAQEAIIGAHIIKSFNLEKKMTDKYNQKIDKSVGYGIKASIIESITQPVGLFMEYSPFLFTLSYGGYLAVKGEVSYGVLIAFMQILIYALGNLSRISMIIASLRNSEASANRIYEILDKSVECNEGKDFGYVETDEIIRFEEVDFSYNEDNQILDKLSFNVKRGETVAIVGSSGSGKSSVLKLLLGNYKIQRGTIKVLEKDINSWNIDALRDKMSYVSQKSYLFPESIFNNIECGFLGAKRDSVIKAAKMANIHEVIEDMPQKYDTMVGENGSRLSGGQKQRLSIARAILKDTPILFLDEATSALDNQSEKEIQKAISFISQNKTTVIVAHRLSTIENADRILVMDNGKIVEEGTHDELLRYGNIYKELYLHQSDSDIKESASVNGGVSYEIN